MTHFSFSGKSGFDMMMGLLGGLAFFLIGMNMMSKSLERNSGAHLRKMLEGLTRNRWISFVAGSFISMIIQSSSATTAMTIGLVNSKFLKFRQTLGIILGAAIGTCITAQLIAFKITDYSLLIIVAGFLLNSFAKHPKYKNIGETLVGFGLIFYGMYVMSSSIIVVQSYQPFINILAKLENPLLGILIGSVATALLQSSAAFIGILMIVGSGGLLTLDAAISLLLGANLGTAFTAIAASFNTSREAKKVAAAQTVFKIAGVLLFVWWIPAFSHFIQSLQGQEIGNMHQEGGLSRQIANAYTVFNLGLAAVLLPLTDGIANILDRLLPGEEEQAGLKTRFLDNNLLPTPSLALKSAKLETLDVFHLIERMINSIFNMFMEKNPVIFSQIKADEEKVNYLYKEIDHYLLQITRENIREERINEAFQILYTVKELEQIGDVIAVKFVEKAQQWLDSGGDFSQEGKREIEEYYQLTIKQMRRAMEVFSEFNLEKAEHMKEKYKQYREISFELERHHFQRLKEEMKQSLESSDFHLELIDGLRIINSHSTNIARIILEWSEKAKDLN
ncbi:MAG: Na/Pi cotransporter family protein [Bacteroidota bacterium]|nr:Na/Pi cotransporter family protein [Bacteroidota bacterium]